MVDLSVVVVSWNVRDLLRRCLRSVRESADDQLRMELIVVDNASADSSADMVLEGFAEACLIANNRNMGFAHGCNQGLAVSQGRYVLFLNPDTEVLDDALKQMVQAMDSRATWGALGPQLLNCDGSVQSSRRRFPTLMSALFESTLLESWWPRNRWAMHYRMADEPVDGEQEVDWVVGACLLFRREALHGVGAFDDRFFMYSEELDLCRRAHAAGWRVGYLPSAKVMHLEGKSSEQVVAARQIRFHTSKVRYFRKHHGPVQAAVLRVFLLLTYAWQIGEEGLKWLVGHKRPLRSERMRAYLQVLSSGLRPDRCQH